MNTHVLIVDDETSLRNNLRRALERAEFRVSTAGTAQEARNALQAQDINVVCLDIGLAEDNGLDLLAELRGMQNDIPVIVMTAHDSASNRTRASELDAAAFMCKPFALSRFREIVRLAAAQGGGSEMEHSQRNADVKKDGVSVMMYSHDSIGLGHMRRNANIAARLVQDHEDVNVLLVVGCPVGLMFELPPRVDFMKLPSVSKVARDDWKAGKLNIDKKLARELRVNLIQRAVEIFEPDVFIVDHVPTGVWGELLPTLDLLKSKQRDTKLVLGLRDILDTPDILKASWAENGNYDTIAKYYDQVLIYGCPDIYDTAQLYGIENAAKGRVTYCGYLSQPQTAIQSDALRAELCKNSDSLVVVSAGGGYDAYPMMDQCMSAFEAMPRAKQPAVVMITGPLMPPELRIDLQRRAVGRNIKIIASVGNLHDYLRAADLVMTMAGYNTVVESIRLGCPTLVMPRSGPSAEQTIRARTFEQCGLVRAVLPDRAEDLQSVIFDCLAHPQPPKVSLGMNGVGEASRQISRLVGKHIQAGSEMNLVQAAAN